MSKAARQRTKGQREPKDGDDAGGDGPVLDEQGEVQMDKLLTVTKGAEQDQEIKQLRAQDEAANQKSHFTLDLGVIVSLILTAGRLKAYLTNPPSLVLAAMASIQLILLLASLTPRSILITATRQVRQNHFIITIIQCSLSAFTFALTRDAMNFPRLARVALPAVMASAVEMQRRGEADTERKLQALEAARYKLKGA